MDETLVQILVLVVLGLVWLFVNMKAGHNWLSVLSLIATLGFIGAASWQALIYAGLL